MPTASVAMRVLRAFISFSFCEIARCDLMQATIVRRGKRGPNAR
jgi:hypothetical protein